MLERLREEFDVWLNMLEEEMIGKEGKLRDPKAQKEREEAGRKREQRGLTGKANGRKQKGSGSISWMATG